MSPAYRPISKTWMIKSQVTTHRHMLEKGFLLTVVFNDFGFCGLNKLALDYSWRQLFNHNIRINSRHTSWVQSNLLVRGSNLSSHQLGLRMTAPAAHSQLGEPNPFLGTPHTGIQIFNLSACAEKSRTPLFVIESIDYIIWFKKRRKRRIPW